MRLRSASASGCARWRAPSPAMSRAISGQAAPLVEDAALAHGLDDEVDFALDRHVVGVEVDVGRLRRLVGRIDAGEVPELAGACLAVEALGIAPLAFGECGVDEEFHE